MKVAVFGATGFVGSAIVETLHASQINVTEMQAPRLSSPNSNRNALATEIDAHVQTNESLVDQLTGFDAVVNAAGIGKATENWTDELAGANALLPSVLATIADIAGVKYFMHLSSAAVLGNAAIDNSLNWRPTSAYSRSKALGEELLLSLELDKSRITIYRPPGVHALDRDVTRKLAKFSRSIFASVAGMGNNPSPQALLSNVSDAVRFMLECDSVPRVVAHPWEGQTTSSALTNLSGGRAPARIPRVFTSPLLFLVRVLRADPAQLRRLEVLWLGQEISRSWLEHAGWKPPVAESGWVELGTQLKDQTTSTEFERHPRIVFAVTASLQVPYLGRTPESFAKNGWDVHVVSSPGLELEALPKCVSRNEIKMVRDPSPWQDAKSFFGWLTLLRRLRPDAVMLGTPKASLLGLIAAKLARVPVRTYLLRGLRLESATGTLARILWFLERTTVWSSTEVLAVSQSLTERTNELRLVGTRPIQVLGSGTSHGLDLQKFNLEAFDEATVSEAKSSLGIPANAFVVGYVGRIRTDKGVPELITATSQMNETDPTWLVLIGRIEESPIEDYLNSPDKPPHIIVIDHVEHIAAFYKLFNVLCLPSHREGFSNVVIEAAALGVPSVVSDATGARDAVIDGETGLIAALMDQASLMAALSKMRDVDFAVKLGANARTRAIREFDDRVVNQRFVKHMSDQVVKKH